MTINTSETPNIDWAASGADEIVQNVFTLLNTHKHEVAYDRTLGLPGELIDLPQSEAVPSTISSIYSVIEESEPRATIVDVRYGGTDEDGGLIFEVVIDV